MREQRWIPNGNFWVPSVILRKFLWFHAVAFAFDGWVMYKVLECTRLAIVLPFRSSVLPWRHRCCYRRGFKVLSNYERNAKELLWKSVKPIAQNFVYVKLPSFKSPFRPLYWCLKNTFARPQVQQKKIIDWKFNKFVYCVKPRSSPSTTLKLLRNYKWTTLHYKGLKALKLRQGVSMWHSFDSFV